MSDTPTGDSPLLCPDRERNNQDTSLAATAAGSHLDHLHIARIGKLCPLIFQKKKKKQSEETYQQMSLISASAKSTFSASFFLF